MVHFRLRRALLAAVLLATGAAAAPQAPRIRVRGRAHVEITEVRREQGEHGEGAVAVSGVLRDDALGAGVSGRAVRIALSGAGRTLEFDGATDGEGRFRVVFAVPTGTYGVEAGFAGDVDYAASAVGRRTVDVARRPVRLALSMPARVGVGGEIPVLIEAREADGPRLAQPPLAIALQSTLLTSDRAPVPSGAPLRLATLHGRTEVRVAIPPRARPGDQLLLEARFDGDPVHDSAQAEATAVLTSPSLLDAELSAGPARRGAPIRIHGRLRDALGPLPSQIVEVAALGVAIGPLGRALTDPQGRFEIAADTTALPAGELRLQARYSPSVSFRDPAFSSVLELALLPAPPLPVAALLAPPVLTALGLSGLLLARRRPWRRLRARLRRAGPGTTPRPVETSAAPPRGLLPARPRRSTLRRPDDHGVDGVVWDEVFGHPVPARVLVVAAGRAGDPGAAASCDVDGRFHIDGLPPGRHHFTVFAAGYLPERFERELPHRGELRGARILLQPVRAEILAIYRGAAGAWSHAAPPTPSIPSPATASPGPSATEAPAHPSADVYTPRELLEVAHHAPAPPPEALQLLTALVEESYYSPRLASDAQLTEALRLAALLRLAAPRAASPGNQEPPARRA